MNIDKIMADIKIEAHRKGVSMGAMTARDIIEKLLEFDGDKNIVIMMKSPIYDEEYNILDSKICPVISDFCSDSWRGSYALPAIGYDFADDAPNNITVKEAIGNLEQLDGTSVTGYKGGDFTFSEDDIVFIANYGNSNDSIAIIDIQDIDGTVVATTNYDMY